MQGVELGKACIIGAVVTKCVTSLAIVAPVSDGVIKYKITNN